MNTLIKNIAEIHSPFSEVKKEQFILIEDQIIKEIDSMSQLDQNTEYDYLVDAAGKIVLPGFVNTHTHAAMTLMRGYADDMPLDKWLQNKIWPFEGKMSAEDIYWGTALAVVEMIKTGTTTFSDMYFAMDRVAKLVKKSGIRAVLAEGLIEANDGQQGLNEALKYALDYRDTADGRITTMLAPHAPYTCGRDYLEQIRELALKNNLPVHIHLSESKKEVKDSLAAHQSSPVKYLADFNFFDNHVLAAHCVHLEPGDLEILKKNKVQVAHNPMSNAKLANGIAPINQYLNNEINVSLGTDGVSSNNSLDMLKEAKMASYLQKIKYEDPTAVDTEKILEIITVNGARALAVEKLGLIEEGYQADLQLIDIKNDSFYYPHHNILSNLFYAADSRSLETVIVAGEILMENKELKTLDQEKIYYEAEKRAFKIAKDLA
ncbi:5-methylthioadenosine/S-adenosylhomocysteine deaminase [Halanaerobium saccharolyticum]|uniref:5-methylthioadenosine/S-adenosylhomocysteine deaminase n=1 Tax=Halanaerobium saccharolyticum TaxID=43595 RepID=A0A4R7YWK5_9FIRM|nr:amidohydrolase [Halanaerobium saccharolyticum]RAK06187.1 5-methylthioadenosine/S-adenosylhomocysteine deaminase [Halanaerobium saccharolyticum]TDW00552.1 5-methylthioadenosine/S-adenosylhomocysteine deaminase [Halanaerobium saccharolyticum]TDX52217.1 5-methylthioadenosine/S-adenosylhomocysteine deaminase [Halanaerobium saccharolyticum]